MQPKLDFRDGLSFSPYTRVFTNSQTDEGMGFVGNVALCRKNTYMERVAIIVLIMVTYRCRKVYLWYFCKKIWKHWSFYIPLEEDKDDV